MVSLNYPEELKGPAGRQSVVEVDGKFFQQTVIYECFFHSVTGQMRLTSSNSSTIISEIVVTH